MQGARDRDVHTPAYIQVPLPIRPRLFDDIFRVQLINDQWLCLTSERAYLHPSLHRSSSPNLLPLFLTRSDGSRMDRERIRRKEGTAHVAPSEICHWRLSSSLRPSVVRLPYPPFVAVIPSPLLSLRCSVVRHSSSNLQYQQAAHVMTTTTRAGMRPATRIKTGTIGWVDMEGKEM